MLENEIEEALRKYIGRNPLPPGTRAPSVRLERPNIREHGDLSTSVALHLSSLLKKPAIEVAESIAKELRLDPSLIERVEVTHPGFINFFYSRGAILGLLKEVLAKKELFGTSKIGGGRKVQVEFVSANPVGPLNVVNGRAAAVGDAIARLLSGVGFDVEKEYYVNDTGTQVGLLARSLASRWTEVSGGDRHPFPDDGYRGEYLVDLAKDLESEKGVVWLDQLRMLKGRERADLIEKHTENFRDYALQKMIESQRRDLDEYDVKFDVWFRESSLHRKGVLESTLKELKERNFVVERDGALWFKMAGSQDENERVLVRTSGEATYFLGDLAYHRDKHGRGFEKVIDIWGPDHHGHIPRMMAGVSALQIPEDWLEIIIVQMVRLVSEGKVVRMSKRAGEFVTLRDLLTEVGKDAARYFFLMRRASSHLDFDIDLARKASSENPVYYVQYAHARARNIVAFAKEKGILPDAKGADCSPLGNEDETRLIKLLALLPDVVKGSALQREPHRMTDYLQELCQGFHQFYTKNRVVGERKDLEGARLSLVEAVSIVIKNALVFLGVNAPEKM